MDTWEYVTIGYKAEPGSSALVVEISINNREQLFKGFISVFDALTQLGQQGWELVAVNGEGLALVCYLKRRIQAS